MKGYQYQVWDTEGVSHLINSQSPLTFEYAETILREMGIDRHVKKITFIGYYYFEFN
jgi:hypothetical protein